MVVLYGSRAEMKRLFEGMVAFSYFSEEISQMNLQGKFVIH